ncbi:glycosyltransferase [Crocosphaera sp. XPORK-15E]|uniref:glycosyltransferase n=1 Tax=Crocosphaera sp. XPORK-15E TaxID=3110247 RepID=UPI002B1F9CFC|nr:glycosyltransferase [Crocosphaera sp. XPORK-15E]MEA5533088.1 glycosyltransferase [Crocosphaera sp. XPORK-15E]
MKKFVIIDHSLSNLQGHHYECSISVAEAAARQGYYPIIVANHTFPKSLYPDNIQIISAFEVDWFNNPVSSKSLGNWKDNFKKILEVLSDNPLEKLSDKISAKLTFYFMYWELTQPKLKLFLEKVQGSTSRLGHWIKQDIELLRSIPLSNTLWGIFKIIWGVLRYVITVISRKINQALIKLLTSKYRSFKDSLSQVLKEIKVTTEDEVFIHTIGIEQVEEVYHLLASSDRSQLPRFHILLRRDIEDPLVIYAKGMGLKTILDQCYESQLWPNIIQFYTDTIDLVQRHNTLSKVIFSQIPIPFRQEKLKESTEKLSLNRPINVVYLGDARPEKGYHYLPDIVQYLWKDYIQPGQIKLTIQSNFSIEGGEGLIPQARLELERYPQQKVTLIKEAMSADDYYQLLGEADLLILPYDPHSYHVRTSGVLTEALAAGKPVVVPSNSWLAKQVDLSRASIYEKPEKIAQEVIRIIENLPQFSGAAKAFSKGWCEQNSPDSLVDVLLSKTNHLTNINTVEEQVIFEVNNETVSQPVPLLVPKVLLILESDLFLDKNLIAPSFINQIEYLGLCGYDIYGLFFANNEQWKGDNYEPFYHQLYPVLDEIFQEFPLKQRWIVNYESPDLMPYNINPKDYIQEFLNQETSLKRDLVDRYNLIIPSDLTQLLQTNQFDVIIMNSIVSYSIIDKFNVTQSSIICEVSTIKSYQYALNNHREIDLSEYQLECQLLNQCNVLILHYDNELEKLEETVKNPEKYIIPVAQDSSKIEYFKMMYSVFTSTLNERALSLKETGKKVAILYPWGDILERKSGASKRVGLLIDYLKSQSYQVWLFTTGEAKDFREDDVHYTYYQQSYQDYCLVKDIYADAYKSWFDALNFDLDEQNQFLETSQEFNHWLPWIYYQYRFDSGFINWVKTLAEWADTIILEYPFWGLTVADICHQSDTQLIVTAHDILAQQLDSSTLIGKIALTEEIKALKQGDHLICVSPNDQAFLQQYKLSSIVIPNPVDLEQDQYYKSTEILLSESHLKQLNQPFCLFVGSQHQPNIEAVKIIRQMAEDFSQIHPEVDCQFVIVGSCWEPEEKDNFIALGKVEDQILSMLYNQAALIILPLLSGTGTSLKTVEAMAYGKVILGTTVAFRGYPMVSGKEGIICDKLEEYPSLIVKLLNNPEQRQEIGDNAQQFSQKYDYRNLYSQYKDLIEGKK